MGSGGLNGVNGATVLSSPADENITETRVLRHSARVTYGRSDHAEAAILLARAAEEAARRALADVGLGGKDAVLTIHDMRSLLECISFVRRTAVQIAVHVTVYGRSTRGSTVRPGGKPSPSDTSSSKTSR
jgi:Family of unknown function (DUF6127)